MKNGQIGLVSTNSFISRGIQWFMKQYSPHRKPWSHAFLVIEGALKVV